MFAQAHNLFSSSKPLKEWFKTYSLLPINIENDFQYQQFFCFFSRVLKKIASIHGFLGMSEKYFRSQKTVLGLKNVPFSTNQMDFVILAARQWVSSVWG